MKKLYQIALLLIFVTAAGASTANALPSFFSAVDEDVFFPGGMKDWELKSEFTGDRRQILEWTNAVGHKITLTYADASPSTAQGVYSGMAEDIDVYIKEKGGNVIALSDFFAVILINDTPTTHSINVLYGTPEGSYLWKYQIPARYRPDEKNYVAAITSVARKHQYDVALRNGNVVMGRWGGPIHEYARSLADNNDPDAQAVYQNLLRTSPSNYDAQIEYSAITDSLEEQKLGATIVARDAEEEVLLNAAATILKQEAPSIADYPVLGKTDKGFEVILIPLEPINPWLLEGIASTYQKITDIPVVIRRLPAPLAIPEPSRSSYRPYLESIASNIWKGTVNFSDWPLATLKAELMKKAEEQGPQSVSALNHTFQQMDDADYQWDALPIVEELSKAIAPYFSGDPDTMVVGITEMDIYAGESNYVFSVFGGFNESPVSVMSYAKMRAKLTGENQSRRRLTERAAKELVPASLKILGIPRSVDPLCPYSYSDGLQRLDEKTMELSEPVKIEIEKRQANGV